MAKRVIKANENIKLIDFSAVDDDIFLKMPLSAQCLYFHLYARVNDDGTISDIEKVIERVGVSDVDLNILISNQYITCAEGENDG